MKTFAELAAAIGCSKWPERWEELYPVVMAEFDQNGCPYSDPQYYQQLHDKYGILEKELDTYKEAAIAIGKNENLSRYLMLLSTALQQRQFHGADMRQYRQPKRPDGQRDIAYDMLPGLAMATQADMCYDLLVQMKLPQYQIDYIMRIPEIGVMQFRKRHGGLPGHSFMEWYQLVIDGKIFTGGRLEFELPYSYNGNCVVFRNGAGDEVILAHELKLHRSGRCLGSIHCKDTEGSWTAVITETDEYWEGNPINRKGLAENRLVRLNKGDWKVVLKRGDPVVNLHIPADGPLSEDAVSASIENIRSFIAEYFPDYQYKAFTAHSWITDPQLVELLGEKSNISKFIMRLHPVPKVSQGDAAFTWVFNKPDSNFDLHDLPENTTLERKIKEHYLSGNAIYEVLGHFY